MFCGTWYPPHQVHNERTASIIMARCTAHARNGHYSTSALNSDSQSCSSTRISVRTRKFRRFVYIWGRYRITIYSRNLILVVHVCYEKKHCRRPANVVRQTRPTRSTGRRGRRYFSGWSPSADHHAAAARLPTDHRPRIISWPKRRLLRVFRLPRTAEGSRTAWWRFVCHSVREIYFAGVFLPFLLSLS